MAGIQASTGLVTGIDIQGTVDKLIALQARPRDRLSKQVKDTQAKQTAIADLTASVIGVQLSVKYLEKTALFEQRAVTSSSPAILTAAAAGTTAAALGAYQFTPVRLARAQHQLGIGLASKTTALGAGTVTIREGGQVNDGIPLSELNNGQGVQQGKIRITDRSGATAVIDLRFAQNIDDVLQAINSNESISVTAVAQGDRIKLSDNTGKTANNLRVQEVGSTTTAANLGLASIDANAASATGNDIRGLSGDLKLNRLNDGNGLSINNHLADLQVTFRDGSTPLKLDFHRQARVAGNANATTQAVAGINGDITLTADATGAVYDGVKLQFIDSGSVTAGNETVAYNALSKTLTVDIQAGSSTANNVISAINNDATAGPLFTASRGTGGNGTGTVALADQATLTGGAALTSRTETTLAELLQTINEADPARLSAAISGDGDHLVFHDLTTNSGGTFAVTDLNGGSLAGDLGVAKAAVGGTLTSDRLLGGLSSPLLHSLNGGRGLGTLGLLALTDRSGATASVDLSSAQTLDDVLSAINQAGLGLKAEVNGARNGIKISDTTGLSASNLILADGDATQSATKLGLAINQAVSAKNSGSLNKQIINEATLLSVLNHGQGVQAGSFTITDSAGHASGINLTLSGAKTLGDVIQAINDLGIGVAARVNDTGDGLLLTDTAGGAGKLIVKDVGGTAAKNLQIAGQAASTTLDGSYAYKVTLSGTDSLTNLVTKLNGLQGNFQASILTDPASTTPFRLSLVSSITGKQGSLTVDDGGLGLGLQELAAGRDALVSLGSSAGTPGLLVSSSSNTFTNAVEGIDVTINAESTDPVTVSVASDSNAIASKLKLFVDQYNKLQDKLGALDFFNTADNSKGILFGSHESLKISASLSGAVSKRVFANAQIQNIAALGITFDAAGKLQFNNDKFNSAYSNNPDAVKTFFTDSEKGFSQTVDKVTESLAGIKNSTLVSSAITLQTSVDNFIARITFLNARLDSSRTVLLKQFYNLEISISKLQNSFSSVQTSLNNLAGISTTSTSTTKA